jgi:hypothetical protein
MSGYAFGTVSNRYYWEMTSSIPITLKQIVKKHFSNILKFSANQFGRREEYIERLIINCQTALNRHGLEINPAQELSLQSFVTTIQLLNGRPQSSYVNIANEFSFHLAPLATFKVSQPMLHFPPEHRRGERIRVEIIKRIQPSVLNIPMFSGQAQAEITNNNELIFPESISDQFIDFVSQNLPRPMLSRLRPMYRRLNFGPVGSQKYNELKRSYQFVVEDSDLIAEDFNLKSYSNDIRWLARLALYVHGVEEVGYVSADD